MALSDSFSFSVNQADICNEAGKNIGVLGEGEAYTSEEYNDVARKLNMLVKQWMHSQDFAPGLKMWERALGDLFLSSSKGVYQLGPTGDNWAASVATIADSSVTFSVQNCAVNVNAFSSTIAVTSVANISVGDFLVVQLNTGDIFSSTVGSLFPGNIIQFGNGQILPQGVSSGNYVWSYSKKGQRPLAIVTAVLRDTQGNDIPLNAMTVQDYQNLPTKDSLLYPADPTAFYYEPQIGSQLNTPTITGPGMIWLDCGACQDVTKQIHMVWIRPVMDLMNPTDNPEYPQQWYRALCWGLSKDICPMFDGTWTQEMEANLTDALAIARQVDPETSSLYFVPDQDAF